jgi:hypothetical protein
LSIKSINSILSGRLKAQVHIVCVKFFLVIRGLSFEERRGNWIQLEQSNFRFKKSESIRNLFNFRVGRYHLPIIQDGRYRNYRDIALTAGKIFERNTGVVDALAISRQMANLTMNLL